MKIEEANMAWFEGLLTRTGAEALEDAIKRYWALRGYIVETWCETIVDKSHRGPSIFCVRSDMINGLPSKNLFSKIKVKYDDARNGGLGNDGDRKQRAHLIDRSCEVRSL